MSSRRLLVMTRLNIGGPARQELPLARALIPEYETTLVAGTPEADEGELSDPEVAVTRIPLVRPVSPRNDMAAFWALRSLLRERFAVMHTHMAKAGAIARSAAISSRYRPVMVHTYHGHVLEGYFSPPVREVFVRIERRLARRTDALIAVSEHVRDELLALGIGSPDRWHVIPLGVDLSELLASDESSGVLRERIGLDEGTPLVGVLGRLARIKDHETLIRSIARLGDVHLAILGDGEMRDASVALCEQLEVSHRVHFVGWWTDVASAIADLDVVALTSRNEGTPVSLIEASAGAKPIVSTDVGGVRAVVDDGVTGLLVPPGDEEGVAAALGRVLADAALRARMGAAGRAHVRDRFDKVRLVADIRALYSSLLD